MPAHRARHGDGGDHHAPHAQRHADRRSSRTIIRTARAKGVKERVIVLRHALRNALIPVVTLGTLQFGELLAGAVLTEQVFGIPGFGKMIVDGVFSRDYAVVQAVVLCTAAFFLLMSLIADVAYLLLNPRLRA